MTFRAKPVVPRTHRPSWEGRDRRNFYLNLGFGLVVVTAVVILLIAAGLSWYNEHLAPVGSVNGQTITKDDLADRYKAEAWRLEEATRRVSNQRLAGHLTDSQASAQQQVIQTQQDNLASIALERLIDTRLQATLAADEGIAAEEADIDARLVTEATIPETRHAWLIEVEPQVDPGALEPTADQDAAAKTRAEQALADLDAGKAWDEVARTVSTDTATAPQAGDLGWIQKTDSQVDEDLLDALFAATVDKPTAVIKGDDGVYRLGRVSEIAAETVDQAYEQKLVNDGIDLARYRAIVAGDVIHQKLEDKVVADATGPAPQRHVSEILIQEAADDLPDDAIKVRHILYAPKDDPSGASQGQIPGDDPAWSQAAAQARVAYDRIKADPELFDSIARIESDEASAKGVTGTGGKLPYFDSSMVESSGLDPAFWTSIANPSLQPGQLLEPIKSGFGWHVIQVMYRPTDDEHLKQLKAEADGGTDFATLARDNSEADSAGRGGDIGWVAKGELDQALSDAIFATPIGKTSEIVKVDGTGQYLFEVLAEETRTPEGRQLESLRDSAFSRWYAEQKDAATIERDSSALAPAS